MIGSSVPWKRWACALNAMIISKKGRFHFSFGTIGHGLKDNAPCSRCVFPLIWGEKWFLEKEERGLLLMAPLSSATFHAFRWELIKWRLCAWGMSGKPRNLFQSWDTLGRIIFTHREFGRFSLIISPNGPAATVQSFASLDFHCLASPLAQSKWPLGQKRPSCV